MEKANTPDMPTIYGTVTFEQFNDAVEVVCKYVEGLANTYAIKDIITEAHQNKLDTDLLLGGISMMRINMSRNRLIEAMKGMKADLERKREAKAEPHDPSEPAQAEPGNTYGPKTENL